MSYKRNYSDEAILAGLKDGNRLVENYFFNRLRERAFGIFCRYQVGSKEYLAMEECLSNSFLILQNKIRLGTYYDHNLEAFALGIIRNSYWDELRKWHRKSRAGMDICQDEFTENKAFDDKCIVGLLEQRENMQVLRWGHQLSERDQQIFHLILQGYSLKEIAKELGVAYGSLRNIYSKKIKEARALVQQRAA
ncbi:MAG: sigma-70 family RNA polymerase sigma factor [Chitinophagales bacterium]|nr:sigma-70 family RNA polymerase sigma factor [Chitinophagales bacterium]